VLYFTSGRTAEAALSRALSGDERERGEMGRASVDAGFAPVAPATVRGLDPVTPRRSAPLADSGAGNRSREG